MKNMLIALAAIITVITLGLMIGTMLLSVFARAAHGGPLLLDPYERSPYLQTLPQMQREWEREKYDRKMIDYQVEQQHEADRRLERDREFNRQLERLHRGW